MDVKSSNASDEKKKRKRLKKLRAEIGQQVEFYFSDANLRKDRFLKQEIDKSEDGYVAISTIATFNRMRKLTTDEALVARALQKSEMLEVSKDKTKLRRRKPMEEPKYSIDDVTVYVENLPHNVDHDMLRKAFSACGTIAYISLPRYKSTGDPKKFAFIEFSTPGEATKACKLLNNPPRDRLEADGHFPTTRKGRLILPEHAADAKQPLESSHSETQSKEKPAKRKREVSETEEMSSDAERVKVPNKKKGAAKDDKADDKAVSASKRKRDASRGSEDDTVDKTQRDKKAKRKAEASQDAEPEKHGRQSLSPEDEKDGQEGLKNKDSRKRKLSGGESVHKKPSHSDKNHEVRSHKGERSDTGVKGDRSGKEKAKKVDSAETHKRKREDSNSSVESSKPLPKVKKSSSGHGDKDASDSGREAKRKQLESETTEDDAEKKRRRRSRSRRNKKEEGEVAPMMQLRVIPKTEWLLLKEEYLALQKDSRKKMKKVLRERGAKGKQQQQQQQQQQREQKIEPQVPDVKPKSTEPEFVPGVVLKISSDKPFASRKELREQLEGISPVAYVELHDKDTNGFIRLKSAEGARTILGKASKLSNDGASVELDLLSGQDEEQYWEKLRADRTTKLSKKRQKKRGVDRILDKSEKVLGTSKAKRSHVIFGGDD